MADYNIKFTSHTNLVIINSKLKNIKFRLEKLIYIIRV